MKKKLYVGCALTQAPEAFVKEVARLKKLFSSDFEVLEFLGLVDGEASKVYEWDIQKCVASCDVFLAICDHPTIGLGYELGTAVEKRGIPVIAAAHKDVKISRLILGITHPKFQFVRYEKIDELVDFVRKFA